MQDEDDEDADRESAVWNNVLRAEVEMHDLEQGLGYI